MQTVFNISAFKASCPGAIAVDYEKKHDYLLVRSNYDGSNIVNTTNFPFGALVLLRGNNNIGRCKY